MVDVRVWKEEYYEIWSSFYVNNLDIFLINERKIQWRIIDLMMINYLYQNDRKQWNS